MFGLTRKKFFMRKKPEGKTARWTVYNHGDPLEFAECSECGNEEDDYYTMTRCPKCGAEIAGVDIWKDEDDENG